MIIKNTQIEILCKLNWFNDFDSFKDKTRENGNANTFINMIIHMIYATDYYVKCYEQNRVHLT